MRPDHHSPISYWEPPGPELEDCGAIEVREACALTCFPELIWEAEKEVDLSGQD